jgi:phage terminase Nu1 subunit (DNA packaging protein)
MISKGDRSTRNQLASWDNEGGAPLSDRNAAEETQAALAEEEENILRCLGAAVILQWNDLPTHIQRRLFENAVSMTEPRHVPQLKEQIARFLHEHKDDDH